MFPLIQNFRHLTITVLLEQSVDVRHDLRFGFANLCHGQRSIDGQRPRCASSQAHVGGNLVGLNQGHVFDEQPQHPLLLPRLEFRIIPDARKIGGERQGFLAYLFLAEAAPLLGMPLVVFLRGGVRAQFLVPLGLQGARHEAMVGSTRIYRRRANSASYRARSTCWRRSASVSAPRASTSCCTASATSRVSGWTNSSKRSLSARSTILPGTRWHTWVPWRTEPSWQT